MTSRVTVDVLEHLSDSDARGVRAVIASATAADGAAPVSEHVLLQFGSAEPGGVHLLVREESGAVIGYAHSEVSPESGGPRTVVDAEAVIDPAHRRRGLGRALLERLVDAGQLARVWSHGDHPGARALGAELGFRVVRELLQLRRPLNGVEDLAEPVLPEGVVLRTFRPGADDAEWLRVNAKAFSWHPEQGRMTQADLDARKAEPWFDPAGFFVAESAESGESGESGAKMIGFHWTKVHPEGLGEVYAVGVDPDRHGGGLGTALTAAGLRHLAGLDLPAVSLYVEADNAPALKVYHRLGFTSFSVDVVHEGPYADAQPQAQPDVRKD
ncbi:mycothiol synthase [Kineosporia succinea]|uniref:Mycothiol acetyltransferase n=1 Tax=Kineosporia succinea TaxID=84632 RepID=A0ABT9P2S2_9ACTN|nr:mycothiol synthase [Kineosporia succinea]MDP9826986.1 mycothiol synthase [Kineosporia succinea]